MKPRYKLVDSARLEPDDNDHDTPRTLRGSVGKLLPVILVPNHPIYVESGGEAYSRLGWCDHCKGYRSNDEQGLYHDRDCDSHRVRYDDGWSVDCD